MAAADVEPSPRGSLSKLRRNKAPTNSSSHSLLTGSADGDDSSEGAGLRASVDAAIDKVKQRARRRSVDDRCGSEESSGNRLSSLLARRKRSPKKSSSGLERHLSAQSGGSLSGNHSDSSLVDESGRSSLLTDDNSDIEGKPIRPTLSPHHSHAGYLTLSSPELSAQASPIASVSDAVRADGSSQTGIGAGNIPQIIEPADTDPTLSIASSKRSSSPRKKLKSAFTTRQKVIGDTDSSISAGTVTVGLGGLFRPRSRANSVDSPELDESKQVEYQESDPDPPAPEAAQIQEQPQTKEVRPETPEQHRRGRINTKSLPSTPPNLVDTPTTLVTPPTPTNPSADAFTFSPRQPLTSAPRNSPPVGRPLNSLESIRHRRAQSANLPSKLSNSIPLPLTPTAEETKTPGGTLTQPTSASGFFSSFISAAQKAADQLSSNINTSVGFQNKSKAGGLLPVEGGEEVIPGLQSGPDTVDTSGEKRQPAVETLGKGDLTLSHLGISEGEERSPMTSAVNLPQQDTQLSNGDANKRAEEEAAARAVSVAYEKPIQKFVSQATGRPLSIASNDRLTLAGDQTPPRSGTEVEGLKRSGSVRSKLSGRRRRHRGSSATTGTGNTIAAAIHSSTTALANPATGGGGHRLTGFAVASSKRNKDFHQLFRSVPEDDYLIEDYSAALQREILLHGRLYVSEGHLCFSSNILGWVTNLVMSFDEVVSVEKKSTAVIFPNAIVIQTLHARNTFASFVARDSTYELLIGIWKISHPNLKSSLNGVTLDNAGTGDKTEVADQDGSSDGSGSGSDDEVYDEDDDDAASFKFMDAIAPSVTGSDAGDVALSRKTSAAPMNGAPQANGVSAKAAECTGAATTPNANSDYPGPATHSPTDCGDNTEHYEKLLIDTTIPAPLGKVYSMLYGSASGSFLRKWLVDNQKSRDLNWPDNYLNNENKTMVLDYIKPLNAPVGPKQTKCITTNSLITFDLERAVTVDCSTQTPDVPAGNVFTTKTRYCLMWGPGNSTRMIANCSVVWTGKSWLKSAIEKGCNDGQADYVNALVNALKAAVSTKSAAKGPVKKGKRKGRKDLADDETVIEQQEVVVEATLKPSWGILEPLHRILEPFAGIFQPFITSQVIIAVLFILLLYTWLSSSRGGAGVGFPDYSSSARLAAYEELWRREESELWDWLEDRVGLDHLYAPPLAKEQNTRQKILQARGMARMLEDERMSEQQMDNAIRITEERLGVLKEAIAKKVKKQPNP